MIAVAPTNFGREDYALLPRVWLIEPPTASCWSLHQRTIDLSVCGGIGNASPDQRWRLTLSGIKDLLNENRSPFEQDIHSQLYALLNVQV